MTDPTPDWHTRYLEARAALKRLELLTGVNAPEAPEPGDIAKNAEALRATGAHLHARLTNRYGMPLDRVRFPAAEEYRQSPLGVWPRPEVEHAKLLGDHQLRQALIELIDERIQAHEYEKGAGSKSVTTPLEPATTAKRLTDAREQEARTPINADATAKREPIDLRTVAVNMMQVAQECNRLAERVAPMPYRHDWESADEANDLMHTYCAACGIPLVPVGYSFANTAWELHKINWRLIRGWNAPCIPANNLPPKG